MGSLRRAQNMKYGLYVYEYICVCLYRIWAKLYGKTVMPDLYSTAGQIPSIIPSATRSRLVNLPKQSFLLPAVCGGEISVHTRIFTC